MELAERLNGIGEYYFSAKLREIDELNRQGRRIINLGIGSPDLPPHPNVVEALIQEARLPNAHAYQSYKGLPTLREAMAGFYQRFYQVQLDPATEILPLMGSKEGIVHLCMTYLNKGDIALVPNPGYPAYRAAVQLTGATCMAYDLDAENNWQPDFDALEMRDLTGVKMMWVNYPNMPTGQLPATGLWEKLVAFGLKHKILICHDNPYSFILNPSPSSILSAPGAMDTAVELNSLSKSGNMAGWRVGMLSGSAKRIGEVLQFKSNMDSGMFRPVQMAAIAALQLPQEWYQDLNAVYQKRKEKAAAILSAIGCSFNPDQAGLFLWAAIPQDFATGYALSDRLLYDKNVFITPGAIFGERGDRYLRISLCQPETIMDTALENILQK